MDFCFFISPTYVYDGLDQLTRENNQAAGKTWVYAYDNGGNILSKTEYAYTTGTLGMALDTITYGYGDSDWKDLLTSYDGQTLTSDNIGNLTNDGTWSYTWQHGRQLAQMSAAGKVAYYTYDAEGHRIGKHYEDILYFIPEGGISYTTVRFPVDTKYFYSGDTLTYVQIIDDSARDIENLKSLYFTYDAVGPLSVNYNGTEYFYLKNAQGDVTGIVDAAGTQVVAYTYDAWGKLLSTTGSMAGTLGEYNPLRYRGYVYDTETGLYYLNSRYYNPGTGRFINADGYVSTGQGIIGNNMFAYCGNNPVNRVDPSGLFWSSVKNFFRKVGAFIKETFGFELEKTDTVTEQEHSIIPSIISVETGTRTTAVVENSPSNTSTSFFGEIADDGYTTGVRIMTGSIETEYALGFSDTHIAHSVDYGNVSYTFETKTDFMRLRTGGELSYTTVTWDNISTTNYIYVSANGLLVVGVLLTLYAGCSPMGTQNYLPNIG